MRPLALRSSFATVACLTLGLLALLVIAPHARAYNPVFKGPVVGISDGLDWGTGKDDHGHKLRPGDKITATLRIGNGIPGQAGYTVSHLRRKKPVMITGSTRTLDFSGARNGHDDGSVTVRLPFLFPFGGLRERSASVSTNGWISFGSPAWDNPERARSDGRGAAAVVGDFERGIMPYWGDLEEGEEGGGVKMVTTAGGRSVAFQWDVHQHQGPARSFQLVLFRDGRFRFDYQGHDKPGGNAFIGYSLGTGPGGYHPISIEKEAEIEKGLLISPRPVQAAKTLPAGRSVLDLPAGAVPELPRECNFQKFDEELGPGEGPLPLEGPTICWIPALKPGEEAAQTVSFKAPGAKGVAKKEVSTPAALGYSAAYLVGRHVIGADDDEVSLSASHHHGYDGPNWISVLPLYSGRSENGQRLESGAPPAVGQWAEFGAAIAAHAGKVHDAVVTVKAPPTATNFQITAYGAPCSPPSSGNVITCSWNDADEEHVSLIARMRPLESAVGSPLTVQFTVTSPGLEPNSETTSSPPVVASP